MTYSLRETCIVAQSTKADLVAARRDRAELLPIVEFIRSGRLVAAVHCVGTQHHGVPSSVIVMGAKGWRADEVRLVMEHVVRHQGPDDPTPPSGALAKSFADDPNSDVREALAVFVAQRVDSDVVTAGTCLRYEYAETEHGPRVRWLPAISTTFRTVHDDAFTALRHALEPSDLDEVIAAILNLDDEDDGHWADRENDLDNATEGALVARGHAVHR